MADDASRSPPSAGPRIHWDRHLAVAGEFFYTSFLDISSEDDSPPPERLRVTTNWGSCLLRLGEHTVAAPEICGEASRVCFINLPTGTTRRGCAGHMGPLHAAVEYPNRFLDTRFEADLIVTASADSTLRLWSRTESESVGTEPCLGILTGHTQPIYGLCSIPDRGQLFSGGFDQEARLWDVAKRACVSTLEKGIGHTGVIFTAAYSQVHSSLFTASFDGKARMFSSRTCRLERVFGHDAGVNSMLVLPEQNALLTGDCAGTVSLFDMRNGRTPVVRQRLHDAVLLPDTDGETDGSVWQVGRCGGSPRTAFMSCGKDGKVHLWDRRLKIRKSLLQDGLPAALYLGETRMCSFGCIPTPHEATPDGTASEETSTLESVSTRMSLVATVPPPPLHPCSVLFSHDLIPFSLVEATGSPPRRVRVPRWLLMDGPSSVLPREHGVGSDRDQTWTVGVSLECIDECTLVECLLGATTSSSTGSSLPPAGLHAYYLLFMDLGLRRWAYCVCRQLWAIEPIGVVVLLARKAALWEQRGRFARAGADDEAIDISGVVDEVSDEQLLRQGHGDDDEEEGAQERPFVPPRRDLSSFLSAAVMVLRLRESELRKDSMLLRALPPSVLGHVFSEKPPIRALLLHSDFVDCRHGSRDDVLMSPTVSTVALANERSSVLFQTRQHANVTLRCEDDDPNGDGEKAHVSILVARSHFFRTMLGFGGLELTSLKEEGTISIANPIRSDGLRHLLQWIYTGTLAGDLEFEMLLRLMHFSEMHFDEALQRFLRCRVASLIAEEEDERKMTFQVLVVHSRVAADLPPHTREWLATICEKKMRISSSVFQGLMDFATDLQTRVDELQLMAQAEPTDEKTESE